MPHNSQDQMTFDLDNALATSLPTSSTASQAPQGHPEEAHPFLARAHRRTGASSTPHTPNPQREASTAAHAPRLSHGSAGVDSRNIITGSSLVGASGRPKRKRGGPPPVYDSRYHPMDSAVRPLAQATLRHEGRVSAVRGAEAGGGDALARNERRAGRVAEQAGDGSDVEPIRGPGRAARRSSAGADHSRDETGPRSDGYETEDSLLLSSTIILRSEDSEDLPNTFSCSGSIATLPADLPQRWLKAGHFDRRLYTLQMGIPDGGDALPLSWSKVIAALVKDKLMTRAEFKQWGGCRRLRMRYESLRQVFQGALANSEPKNKRDQKILREDNLWPDGPMARAAAHSSLGTPRSLPDGFGPSLQDSHDQVLEAMGVTGVRGSDRERVVNADEYFQPQASATSTPKSAMNSHSTLQERNRESTDVADDVNPFGFPMHSSEEVTPGSDARSLKTTSARVLRSQSKRSPVKFNAVNAKRSARARSRRSLTVREDSSDDFVPISERFTPISPSDGKENTYDHGLARFSQDLDDSDDSESYTPPTFSPSDQLLADLEVAASQMG